MLHEDLSNHQMTFKQEAERDSVPNDRVLEANGVINEVDYQQELRTVLQSKMKTEPNSVRDTPKRRVTKT